MDHNFAIYDELAGPDLDAARWSPARLPLPTGEHVPLDPNAELAVGDGELRVKIPRFSLANDTFQAADSPKYLVFSTGEFELRPDRPATFAVDLAVENIGGGAGGPPAGSRRTTGRAWPPSTSSTSRSRSASSPSAAHPPAWSRCMSGSASAAA